MSILALEVICFWWLDLSFFVNKTRFFGRVDDLMLRSIFKGSEGGRNQLLPVDAFSSNIALLNILISGILEVGDIL